MYFDYKIYEFTSCRFVNVYSFFTIITKWSELMLKHVMKNVWKIFWKALWVVDDWYRKGDACLFRKTLWWVGGFIFKFFIFFLMVDWLSSDVFFIFFIRLLRLVSSDWRQDIGDISTKESVILDEHYGIQLENYYNRLITLNMINILRKTTIKQKLFNLVKKIIVKFF